LATFAVWAVAGPVALLVPVLLALPRVRPDLRWSAGALAAAAYAAAALFILLQPGRLPDSGTGAYGAPAQVLTAASLAALLVSILPTERR
jgi:hypothetical protein